MATKARTITSMDRDGYTVDSGEKVRWSAGLRPELLAAWGITKALLGEDVLPRVRPISLSAHDLSVHLADAHGDGQIGVPDPSGEPVKVPAPAVAPVAPVAEPEPAQSVDVSATTSDGGDPALLAALAEFVRTVGARAVDADQVREIVAEAVASLPRTSGTTIHVPNRPEPVTLSGVAHRRFPHLLDVLSQGLGAYLYGPPATGKSHAAENAAEALGLRFCGTLACSPDMMPTALRGFVDAQGVYRGTAFRDAYENGGVFVIDEGDNAPSAVTVGLLNTAMASASLVFPDGNVRKSPEFRCVLTANTNGAGPSPEFVGRFPLDPSTQTRFVRLAWDYDENVDRAVVALSGADDRIVDGVMDAIVRMRENIAANGLRLFVTAREGRHAAALLAIGWSWDDVLDSCLIPVGCSGDQRRQVLTNVRPVTV